MVTIGLSRTVSEINGDIRRKSHENHQFSHPVYLTPPLKELPLEFGIGVRGPKCLSDEATRRSKKFSDRFSRFDTIPAATDTQPATQPASQPASHVAVAITLNAKASSLKTRDSFVNWNRWKIVPYIFECDFLIQKLFWASDEGFKVASCVAPGT